MTVTTNYFLTAATLKAAFTTSTRDNGDTFHHLIDGVPDAVTDFVRDCHDKELPNDWRYAAIVGMLQGIIETDLTTVYEIHELSIALADAEVDIYTSDLLNWYAENPGRIAYVDQAVEDGYKADFTELLSIGQYRALEVIAVTIIDALELYKS